MLRQWSGRARALPLAALLAVGLAFAAGTLAAAPAEAPSQLAGPALRDALLRGGHILYFRHTSTDFGQNDDAMTSFDDCTKQRNLTEQGRAEARAIGAAVARLRIPIGDVLASPYCRTLETGRLMFGRATATLAVRGGPASDEPGRYAALRDLLGTPVQGRVNLVIESHGNPFRAVAGPPYLAEGEAAVVLPLGGGAFRVVARIPKDGWDALER